MAGFGNLTAKVRSRYASATSRVEAVVGVFCAPRDADRGLLLPLDRLP